MLTSAKNTKKKTFKKGPFSNSSNLLITSDWLYIAQSTFFYLPCLDFSAVSVSFQTVQGSLELTFIFYIHVVFTQTRGMILLKSLICGDGILSNKRK